MSTDLVTLNTNAVAMVNPVDYTGLDEMVTIRPTALSLVQNTTKDPRGAKAGQYLDELTGEAFDSLVVVPMQVSRNRVMFPPGAGFGEEALCRSNDGKVPSPFAKVPQAKKCETCMNSQWVNKQRPACRENWKLSVIIKETGIPRNIQFSGMGIGTLRKALEAIQQNKVIKNAEAMKAGQPPVYTLYSYYFTLGAERKSNSRGVYYQPIITDIKFLIDPTEFGPVYEQYIVARRGSEEVEEAAQSQANMDNQVEAVVDGAVPWEENI